MSVITENDGMVPINGSQPALSTNRPIVMPRKKKSQHITTDVEPLSNQPDSSSCDILNNSNEPKNDLATSGLDELQHANSQLPATAKLHLSEGHHHEANNPVCDKEHNTHPDFHDEKTYFQVDGAAEILKDISSEHEEVLFDSKADYESTEKNLPDSLHQVDNGSVSVIGSGSVQFSKPVARASSMPPTTDFKKLVPKWPASSYGTDDSLLEVTEASLSVQHKTKPAVKPPPPRPKIAPPVKPKLTPPPPPPPPKSSNTAVSSNASTPHQPYASAPNSTSTQSSKHVTRKESASKKIDLIKKKGLQIKKAFGSKSRTSHGDGDEMNDTEKPSVSLSTDSSVSSTSNQNAERRKSEHSKPIFNTSSAAHLVDKPKRTPPPRPALPAALQKRHTSENIFSPSGNLTSTPKSKSVSHNVSPISEDFSCKNESHTSLLSSDERRCSDVFLEESHQELISKSDGLDVISSKEINEFSSVQSPPKLENKPARPPPPTQFSTNSITIPIKKKSEKEPEEELSFLDLVKDKKGDRKQDDRMKDYISSEIYCVAIEDYQASNFTDISFNAGEKILVLKELDDGLLFGRNEDGEEGPFPSKYVCQDTS